MVITNLEKQILQKHYAERIKSLSTDLKSIIQDNNQTSLAKTIERINDFGDRIVNLQLEWENDQRKSREKAVQEAGSKIYD